MNNRDLSRIYFVILLVVALVLLGIFASSFVHATIFAFILSGILFPYSEIVYDKFRIPRVLNAILICVLFTIGLLVPVVFIIFKASSDSIAIYNRLSEFLNAQPGGAKDAFIESTILFLARFNINLTPEQLTNFIDSQIESVIRTLLQILETFTSNIFNFIVQFALMLMMMVGILTHGFKLKNYVMMLFLTEKRQDVQRLIEKFNAMNTTTLVVNTLVGLIQGSALIIVMFFLDFDSVLFWGLMIGLSALVPVTGILLVTLPLAFYNYLLGFETQALIFGILSVVISLTVENIIKPKLISRGASINPFLLLLSLIGGISEFGFLGIFYGPLVLGMFITLVEIYKDQTKDTV